MKYTPEEIDKFGALVGVGKLAAGLVPLVGPPVAAIIARWDGYKKSQYERSLKEVLELLAKEWIA